MKKLSNRFFLFLLALTATIPACAYYFQGYYVPKVLVSPMKDNIVYTPVGLGIVSSRAGFRVHPVTGRGDFHSGVDLSAKLNEPVYNLLDGIVTRVGYRGNLGVSVEVYHPYPNLRTICGHLNAYSVVPGQWAQRGRVIGYAGCTGRSTGVHVHYTVLMENPKRYVDPMAYLMRIPQYVAALKTARMKVIAQRNAQVFKKAALSPKPVHSEEEELPEKTNGETAPPTIDAKEP